MTDREPTLAEQIAWLESDVKAHPNYGHILASLCRLQAIEQDGWIKCSERLPEPGQQVVIARKNGTWDRGECNPIYFDGLPAWYLPEGPTFTEDVTHWRPLPPLPRSE